MINLQVPVEVDRSLPPFVCRVEEQGEEVYGDNGLSLAPVGVRSARGRCGSVEVGFPRTSASELEGDVLMIVPGHGVASRLVRRGSSHNTLLFTEQCDQLCVMCSQPPKRVQDQWRLPFYKQALKLADPGVTIGISGGEPTLQRDLFFDLLEDVAECRPDLQLHVLTNAQHFRDEDVSRLRALNKSLEILWGVPLYAPDAATHDRVVFKEGAYDLLLPNFYRLAAAHAGIELRTVLTGMNYATLPQLADFISKNLFFVKVWAIMGLEPTGFAKAFKGDIFVDHSVCSEPLEHALDIATARRLPAMLYNVPLCTVSPRYRKHCADTISDWKRKFLPQCEHCRQRSSCSGFFEWYNEKWSYEGVHPLTETGEES